jgi:hypothetical protein
MQTRTRVAPVWCEGASAIDTVVGVINHVFTWNCRDACCRTTVEPRAIFDRRRAIDNAICDGRAKTSAGQRRAAPSIQAWRLVDAIATTRPGCRLHDERTRRALVRSRGVGAEIDKLLNKWDSIYYLRPIDPAKDGDSTGYFAPFDYP